jgi:hypothetical protein
MALILKNLGKNFRDIALSIRGMKDEHGYLYPLEVVGAFLGQKMGKNP